MMDTNVRSTFLFTRHTVPGSIKSFARRESRLA